MVNRHPAVIAQCATPEEVAEALAYARNHNLDVAVRAGGHSVAGMSTNDGGLVVDVRPMKAIFVETEDRTVTAGAGVTWGEFDRAAQEHGLAVTGGRASTTGVAGFTLGGGQRVAAIWNSLHIEKKRAWIRNSMDVVLHRHYRGSARVFDPGTVQILIKHSSEGGANVENVAQWKQLNPPGQEPKRYNVMMQPGRGPGLPFTQGPPSRP